MMFRVKIARTKIERVKILLDTKTLLDLLRSQDVDLPEHTHMSIYMRVPGGGDWSNMNLEIDDTEERCIFIEWEKTTEEEEG